LLYWFEVGVIPTIPTTPKRIKRKNIFGGKSNGKQYF